MEKLKALKFRLRNWNKDVFGRVEERKRLASHWDDLESQRPLSLNEMEEKVAAVEDFKKRALLEETWWGQKSREIQLVEKLNQ